MDTFCNANMFLIHVTEFPYNGIPYNRISTVCQFYYLQVSSKGLKKGSKIIGICAQRFHSVLYTDSAVLTFGLNAGQLGEWIEDWEGDSVTNKQD